MSERTSEQKQAMLAGKMYDASDPLLTVERLHARKLVKSFNGSEPEDAALREQILRELFGRVGKEINIEPTFRCDYGYNISVGEKFYANFGCVMLDVVPITIGDEVLFAPNVQLLAASHPLDPAERASGQEFGAPITIGSRVWLGGGVIVCPGVTIGNNTTIGAGSVVVRDIPDNVVAVGNPCRVLRKI